MSTFVGKYPPFKLDASGNILVKLTNPGAAQTPWLSNIDAAGFLLNNLGDPLAAQDAATKAYVDAFVSGLTPLAACRVATTAALTATYSNGTAGVGATLTNATTQAAISIDGVSLSAADRVLVKNQAAAAQNGLYTVTTVGSGAVNWVLTRATDFDTSAEMIEGSYTNITAGTTNQGRVYLFTTSQPITVGTTALNFSQFGAFGTMATQNANAVAITGGTINGVVIGGVTPAAATFTTAAATTFTGALVGNADTSTYTNQITVSPASDNTNYSITLSANTGPAIALINTGAGFTYNPSTNVFANNVGLGGSPTTTTQTSTDNSTKVATTAYVTTAVTNALAGVNQAVEVSAATTAAANTSAWTYNNGVSGVGATFTGPVNTAITIDGILFNTITTQSLLIKNDTQSPSGAFNGTYVFTAAQTVGTGAIFTRRTDYNSPSNINNTGAIPVVGGTVNALTSWLLTSNVVTVGTSPINYSQFTYSPLSIISPALGGTGIANNAASTITISGSFGTTFTVTGSTSVTLPTSGTLTTLATVISTANTWNAIQTFTNSDIKLLGSSTGATTFTSANAGASNFTLTFPAVNDTLATIGTAQTWTAVQTFTNSDIALLGSSTGKTTFTSANAGASNFTLTFPAVTDTLATIGTAQTFTAAQRVSYSTLTDAGTVAVDLSLSNNFRLTLGGNRALGVPTNAVAGQMGVINVRQDSTGSRLLTYTWPYEFGGGAAPLLSTGKFAFDQLNYVVDTFATSTVTMTIAAPCVVTWTTHGLISGQKLQLTTTGALPTGLTANTSYWVNVVDANTFNLSTSLVNLQAGTFITTTGSQSGVQTATAMEITVTANFGITSTT